MRSCSPRWGGLSVVRRAWSTTRCCAAASKPARLILIILGLLLVLPGVEIEPNVKTRFPAWLDACLTAAVGWQGFTLTGTIHDVVAARHDLSAADILAAREVHTRVRVLQRILDATRANIKAFLNGTPQNIVT